MRAGLIVMKGWKLYAYPVREEAIAEAKANGWTIEQEKETP